MGLTSLIRLCARKRAAPDPAPLLLAGQQLADRPVARGDRTNEDHHGRRHLSSAKPLLELRAGAPNLARPLQRQHPIRPCTHRYNWRHGTLHQCRAPKRTTFAIDNDS
jgi:hypothetical protein